MAAMHGSATAYLFLHPTDGNFVTWGTITGATLTGLHWLTVKYDKDNDAPH